MHAADEDLVIDEEEKGEGGEVIIIIIMQLKSLFSCRTRGFHLSPFLPALSHSLAYVLC